MVFIYFDGSKIAYLKNDDPIFSFGCDVDLFEEKIAEFKNDFLKIMYVEDEKELDRMKTKQLENIIW